MFGLVAVGDVFHDTSDQNNKTKQKPISGVPWPPWPGRQSPFVLPSVFFCDLVVFVLSALCIRVKQLYAFSLKYCSPYITKLSMSVRVNVNLQKLNKKSHSSFPPKKCEVYRLSSGRTTILTTTTTCVTISLPPSPQPPLPRLPPSPPPLTLLQSCTLLPHLGALFVLCMEFKSSSGYFYSSASPSCRHHVEITCRTDQLQQRNFPEDRK